MVGCLQGSAHKAGLLLRNLTEYALNCKGLHISRFLHCSAKLASLVKYLSFGDGPSVISRFVTAIGLNVQVCEGSRYRTRHNGPPEGTLEQAGRSCFNFNLSGSGVFSFRTQDLSFRAEDSG